MSVKKKFNLGEYLSNNWIKIIRMIIGVCLMGVGIAFLNLTSFGPDPCSALHYAMAEVTGLSFGTYQVTVNLILLVFVIFMDRKLLGPGTLGNMVLVGYSADFTSWLLRMIFGEINLTAMWSQVVVMIPALILFIFAAATYMNCELGTAPYDALSFWLHKQVCKLTGKQVSFKLVRIFFDGVVAIASVVVCLLKQMELTAGLVTALMVFTLGPAVDFVAKIMNHKKRQTNEKA